MAADILDFMLRVLLKSWIDLGSAFSVFAIGWQLIGALVAIVVREEEGIVTVIRIVGIDCVVGRVLRIGLPGSWFSQRR